MVEIPEKGDEVWVECVFCGDCEKKVWPCHVGNCPKCHRRHNVLPLKPRKRVKFTEDDIADYKRRGY